MLSSTSVFWCLLATPYLPTHMHSAADTQVSLPVNIAARQETKKGQNHNYKYFMVFHLKQDLYLSTARAPCLQRAGRGGHDKEHRMLLLVEELARGPVPRSKKGLSRCNLGGGTLAQTNNRGFSHSLPSSLSRVRKKEEEKPQKNIHRFSPSNEPNLFNCIKSPLLIRVLVSSRNISSAPPRRRRRFTVIPARSACATHTRWSSCLSLLADAKVP